MLVMSAAERGINGQTITKTRLSFNASHLNRARVRPLLTQIVLAYTPIYPKGATVAVLR
jgi:hypothetical protein